MIGPVGNDPIKRYRLIYNLEALEKIREKLDEKAYTRLKALIEYRLHGKDFDRSPIGVKIALAFSGGSDSTATLKVLRWAGFDVVSITAKLPQMKDDILKRLRAEGTVFVDVPNYLEIITRQMKKGAPICGRCHTMVMNAVEDYAKRNDIGILASGDLLSSGLVSIYETGGIVILNLPAFLAMDKAEIIELIGGKYDLKFGCPLLWEAFRNTPSIKRFAIQRVLRELRARAITQDIAEKLILDILSR